MNDRAQKQAALKLSAANLWFPQLEVDVTPRNALATKAQLVTDLDVFSSIPDPFKGYRSVIFDCKTKAKESPINRCLWLAGLADRLRADQGFCILKKNSIDLDHRLMANSLNITLLEEGEFDKYATATCHSYKSIDAKLADIDLWEELFSVPKRFPKLGVGFSFLRSSYWMIDDPAEACRKLLATLKSIQPELDPNHKEHFSLFLEFSSLFARSLAVVCNRLFKTHLFPDSQSKLSDALLIMLYGGRDAYDHRNALYKKVIAASPGMVETELSLPEWNTFIQLVRQMLDAPLEILMTPLILRELAFCVLSNDFGGNYLKNVTSSYPQAMKFAFLVPTYLCRAASLPPDFAKMVDNRLIGLISVK